MTQEKLEVADNEAICFFRVAKIDDIASGSAVRVLVGGLNIALFNLDGAFYATDEICSHAYASLVDGFINDDTVECPLHGACFSIATGKALSAPATDPIKTYPVRVVNDEILVGILNDTEQNKTQNGNA